MKCKTLIFGMIAATVLGSGLVTIEAVLAQKPVGTADSSATTAQSITRQIAELEVERALQNVRFLDLTRDS